MPNSNNSVFMGFAKENMPAPDNMQKGYFAKTFTTNKIDQRHSHTGLVDDCIPSDTQSLL